MLLIYLLIGIFYIKLNILNILNILKFYLIYIHLYFFGYYSLHTNSIFIGYILYFYHGII